MNTKPPPGATIDYGHPINRGLIGWWLFNEGAGSRVSDISGNGNHGTITNVDLTTGWIGSPQGGALDFDGVNDHAIVPRGDSLRPLTSISVVAIVNGSGVGAFDYVLTHYNTTGNQRSWSMQTNAGGSLFLVILSANGAGTSGGEAKSYTSSAEFVAFDATSHQIGFTFDGPSGTLELYADGVRDESPTKSVDDVVNSLHDSTSDIYFASLSGGGGNWDGSHDDIKIYDHALSSTEMHDLSVNPYAGIFEGER